MNQRLQDLATLLKRDRKTQVIAGAVFLAIMFLMFAEPKRHAPPKRDMSLAAGTGAATSDERYGDLVTSFKRDLETSREQAHQQSQIIEEQRQKQEEFEKRTAEIFKRVLERVNEVETAAVSASLGSTGMPNIGDGSGAGSISGTGGGGADGSLGAPGSLGGGGAYGGSGTGPDGLSVGGYTGAGGAMGQAGGPMGRGGQAMAMNAGYGGSAMTDGGFDPDRPESFGFDAPQVSPPPQLPERRAAVVGEGDSVRVKVLAGVNAPTDGTPYPVVLQLVGDVQGPDGSQLPLGEARMIAAAQGSLTDGRALFRLSSLNIRLPNGRRKMIEIDGYIVGEDGKLGMEGVVIDPLSKILGAVTIAGAIEGTGEAIAQQQITTNRYVYGESTSITGDAFKYGAGKGIQKGSDEWSNIIKERAQQLVPHVEVLSGRQGTAVFSKAFVIPDLYDALASEEEDGSL